MWSLPVSVLLFVVIPARAGIDRHERKIKIGFLLARE
jgi:hypothetical protein